MRLMLTDTNRIYPSKVSYLNNLVICTIIDKTETVGRSSVHFNLNIDFFSGRGL